MVTSEVRKFWKLLKSSVSVFSLIAYALGGAFKTSVPHSGLWRFMPVLSSYKFYSLIFYIIDKSVTVRSRFLYEISIDLNTFLCPHTKRYS